MLWARSSLLTLSYTLCQSNQFYLIVQIIWIGVLTTVNVNISKTLFELDQIQQNIHQLIKSSCFVLDTSQQTFPNRHIFVDSPSIRHRNSTWKIRGNYIDFKRRIHVEIMTSIRHRYFDVDSTFKIDKISMSFLLGFFCTRCFHFLTFSPLGTYSKLFWYNAESL